jgi:hypothetical protein
MWNNNCSFGYAQHTMPQVKNYIRVKVRWDKIPDAVVISYDKDIIALKAVATGAEFKKQSIEIYNKHFRSFGYVK